VSYAFPKPGLTEHLHNISATIGAVHFMVAASKIWCKAMACDASICGEAFLDDVRITTMGAAVAAPLPPDEVANITWPPTATSPTVPSDSSTDDPPSSAGQTAGIVVGVAVLLVLVVGALLHIKQSDDRIPAPIAIPNPAFDAGNVLADQALYAVPMEGAEGAEAVDYMVAVNRNPEYHYAPPLNPPRFGEDGGNLDLMYEDADADADRQGNTGGGGGVPVKDADGYVLDETAAPSVVYASYISSTEAGVGNYEVVDGAVEQAQQTNAVATGGAAAPLAPTAPTAVQRCPNCRAKVQVCTCRLRRGTQDMANKPQAQCVQSTSQGPCQELAVGKSPRCREHTCEHSKCRGAKSSKAKFCKKHQGKQKKNLEPGGGGMVGGGAGAGADEFIPAAYDAGPASNAARAYAAPFEDGSVAVYGEAEHDQSLA
jgi:hypothetical protein